MFTLVGIIGSSAGCSRISDSSIELMVSNSTSQQLEIEIEALLDSESILSESYTLEPGTSDSKAELDQVPDTIVVQFNGRVERIGYQKPELCENVLGINIAIRQGGGIISSTDCGS